jgi:hypothetical protein
VIAAVLAALLLSPLGAPAAPELLIKLRVRIAHCPATPAAPPADTVDRLGQPARERCP